MINNRHAHPCARQDGCCLKNLTELKTDRSAPQVAPGNMTFNFLQTFEIWGRALRLKRCSKKKKNKKSWFRCYLVCWSVFFCSSISSSSISVWSFPLQTSQSYASLSSRCHPLPVCVTRLNGLSLHTLSTSLNLALNPAVGVLPHWCPCLPSCE